MDQIQTLVRNPQDQVPGGEDLYNRFIIITQTKKSTKKRQQGTEVCDEVSKIIIARSSKSFPDARIVKNQV